MPDFNTILNLFVLLGVVAALLLLRSLRSYTTEKGKNLATKEDIAAITREVEKVRLEFALLLERDKQRHDLRLAAVDRRLAAHQEAYTRWWELKGALFGPRADLIKVVLECQDWWVRNRLYLDPEVTRTFRLAYLVAMDHRQLWEQHAPTSELNSSGKIIDQAGDEIVKTVQLPSLQNGEYLPLKQNEQTS